MLTIKNLKSLIEKLPDSVGVRSYEGEGCGLQVSYPSDYRHQETGWIETGWSGDKECDPKEYDLKEFGIDRS